MIGGPPVSRRGTGRVTGSHGAGGGLGGSVTQESERDNVDTRVSKVNGLLSVELILFIGRAEFVLPLSTFARPLTNTE